MRPPTVSNPPFQVSTTPADAPTSRRPRGRGVRSALWLTASMALGVAALDAGCGNGLHTTYIPASRFAAAYAQALCTSLQHCCAENAVKYDYDQCTSGWKNYVDGIFGAPNSAALANYDSRAATECVNAVSAAAGVDCGPVPGSISDARATCQAIFAGKKAEGQECTTAAECAPVEGSNVICAPLVGDAGGQLPLARPLDFTLGPRGASVCIAVPLPSAGVPCTIADGGAGSACNGDPASFCDPATLTCAPRADAGGPCSAQIVASCNDGAYCVSSGPSAGLCAPALPPGSPCTNAAQCDTTSFCDTAGSHTCVARKRPGSACTADTDCSVDLCDPTAKICLRNVIATTAACTGKGP